MFSRRQFLRQWNFSLHLCFTEDTLASKNCKIKPSLQYIKDSLIEIKEKVSENIGKSWL